MAQYFIWEDPTSGACSPALSEFFDFCDPAVPAIVHWARWLRIDHESDEGSATVPVDLAAELVEAMIRQIVDDPAIASAARRAVQGERIGERDPHQLNLF